MAGHGGLGSDSESGSSTGKGMTPTGGAHLSAVEEKGKEWEAGLGCEG